MSHKDLYYARLYKESYFKLKRAVLVYQSASFKNKQLSKQIILDALRQLNQARRTMGYTRITFEEVVNSISTKVGFLKFR